MLLEYSLKETRWHYNNRLAIKPRGPKWMFVNPRGRPPGLQHCTSYGNSMYKALLRIHQGALQIRDLECINAWTINNEDTG